MPFRSFSGAFNPAGSHGLRRAFSGIGQVLSRTDPAAFKISQRITTAGGTNNLGIGTTFVPITLTTAQPTYAAVEVRTRDATTLATLQNWRTVATNVAAGSPTLSVTGIDARLGWHLLDLRVNGDDSTIVLGANKQGMGRLVALSGQSLALQFLVNGFGTGTNAAPGSGNPAVSISPYCSVYADVVTGAASTVWQAPSDAGTYTATGVSEFLRLQVAASNVNCGVIGRAKGSQTIGVFVPGPIGTENTRMRNALTAAGGFEASIWIQGHADAIGLSTGRYYQQQLTAMYNDLAAYNVALGSGYQKLIVTVPNFQAVSAASGLPKPVDVIRRAAETWASANSATNMLIGDMELGDGTHPSQVGNLTFARHFHRATRPALGLAHGDLGPQITSATRASGSKQIVLTTSLQSGATALVSVGLPSKRFSVFPANTGTAASSSLAFDATTPLTITGTTITLQLAALPTGADSAALDVMVYFPADPTSNGSTDNIFDNLLDAADTGISIGRQLRGTLLTGVRVAAPDATVPAVPPQSIGTDLIPSGVYVPAYAAGGIGSQRMTSGVLNSSGFSDIFDTLPTFTIEGRVIVTAGQTPAGNRVTFGAAGKAFVGITPGGNIYASFQNTSNGTTSITSGITSNDGAEHHVALVCTPSGTTLYVDGVSRGTSAVVPITGVGQGVFSIGNLSNISSFNWPGTTDEVAVWNIAKYTTGFTAPTTPYVGNETGLVALYHLDGNGNAATY